MTKFGPSGNSNLFYEKGYKSSVESPVHVKEMGLDTFEYSFGRGVNLGEEKAVEIGKAFLDNGVSISVHAPYYINLANPEEENAEKSYMYIIESAKKVKLMGGNRVIFHPASQGKMSREKAVELTKDRFLRLTERIYRENLDDIIFCPETMGKLGQIGTIEEVIEFCLTDKIFIPVVDFGHVNAREWGSLKTQEDYDKRLKYMVDRLGYEKMKNFHIHFSKIEYSAKGEVKHLTFLDDHYGPEFLPLAKSLIKFNLEPIVICESAGTQDIDAKEMKDIYTNLLK